MKWTIIVFLNGVELALAAAADALNQGEGSRCLIIGNGVSTEDRKLVERFCHENDGALAWFHDPSLPSLSATWNRALQFVWGTGASEALVANHDVRFTADTFDTLKLILGGEKALLVTATGVEEEETLFAEAQKYGQMSLAFLPSLKTKEDYLAAAMDPIFVRRVSKGGPGFSLFMISRAGHEKYPFDEALVPAFTEDLMWHRTAILQGDGDRVFGTNVRYLHLGGQTLKRMSPERKAAHELMISRGSRAHYENCWGGPVNQEKWVIPFTPAPTEEQLSTLPSWIRTRFEQGEDVTTPALFDAVRKGW